MSNYFTFDSTADVDSSPTVVDGTWSAPADHDPNTPTFDPYPADSDPPKRRGNRHLFRNSVIAMVVVVLVMAIGTVVFLVKFSPPTTATIASQDGPVVHHDMSIDHISRYLLTAIVLDEDQDYRTRDSGPDWGTFIALAEQSIAEHQMPDEGASTIPQQLAKNLFLYQSDNPFLKFMRKAVEAPLAELLARGLTKKRLLEIYSNSVQFGPKLFGACAAAWYYFRSAPWDLTPYQASQLAAILPLPSLAVRVDKPQGGLYVNPPLDPNGKQYKRFHAKLDDRSWWTTDGDNSYTATMADIGITDEASDHAADRGGSDSCSTMPADVAQLLLTNGYR